MIRGSKAQIGRAMTEAGAGPFSLGRQKDRRYCRRRPAHRRNGLASVPASDVARESDYELASGDADNDEKAERLSMAAE